MRRDPDPVRIYITLADGIVLGVALGLGLLLVWSAMVIGLGLVAYATLRSQL